MRMKWRLIGWCTLVAFMAAIAYAAQLSSGAPEKDVAYQWSSSIFGAVQYALMFGIILLLTRGLDRKAFLAFRRPPSWRRAAGIGAAVILVVFVVSAIVAQFANAEREQGLIPEHWDSSRVAPFVAFCVVVVVTRPSSRSCSSAASATGSSSSSGSTRRSSSSASRSHSCTA